MEDILRNSVRHRRRSDGINIAYFGGHRRPLQQDTLTCKDQPSIALSARCSRIAGSSAFTSAEFGAAS
jgi:hypothetical protein